MAKLFSSIPDARRPFTYGTKEYADRMRPNRHKFAGNMTYRDMKRAGLSIIDRRTGRLGKGPQQDQTILQHPGRNRPAFNKDVYEAGGYSGTANQGPNTMQWTSGYRAAPTGQPTGGQGGIQRPTMEEFQARNPSAKMSRTASPQSAQPGVSTFARPSGGGPGGYRPSPQTSGPGGYQASPQFNPNTPGGIFGMWQQGHDEARAANEKRYQEVLRDLTATRDRNMALLENVGAQQGKDLRSDYRKLGTRGGQNLISAGLGNTTAVGTMQAGVQREQQDAQARLQAGLNRERIGYDERFNTAIAGFKERRTDAYPDLGQFAEAMKAMGSYYGGPRSTGGGGGGRFTTNTQGTIHPESRRARIEKEKEEGGWSRNPRWKRNQGSTGPAAPGAAPGRPGGYGKRDPVPGFTGGMYDPETMERVDGGGRGRGAGFGGRRHVGPKGSAQPTPGAQGGRRIPKKTGFWALRDKRRSPNFRPPAKAGNTQSGISQRVARTSPAGLGGRRLAGRASGPGTANKGVSNWKTRAYQANQARVAKRQPLNIGLGTRGQQIFDSRRVRRLYEAQRERRDSQNRDARIRRIRSRSK